MDIYNRRKDEEQIQHIPLKSHSKVNEQLNSDVYGRKLQSPILGYRYQFPDLPKDHASHIILDTSLLHIPVYTHLKIYDLKPVHRPPMSQILSAFSQLPEALTINKSSTAISSRRTSERDKISISYNVKNREQELNKN